MKVLITTIPFSERDERPLDLLKMAGADVVINPLGRKLSEQDLAEMIPGFGALIAGTEPITESVLAKSTDLRLISRVGIGLDNVDLNSARRRGIDVCYTPDAPSPAVAELTIALMIDLLRSVQVSNLCMHRGEWYRYFGKRLAEVTIGIIGAGRIGTKVLRHLSGFECSRILVNDIEPCAPLPDHMTCDIERVDKETIYCEADIITLHVPLTNHTKNMITRNEISQMKPGTLLINTARGGIINEQDLFDALEEGHLGGAAIDVFREEPYNGKLVTLDQCLLTAHMGSMSVDCRTRMEIEATEEVVRLIGGESLRSPIPEFEYANQLS